MSAEARVSTTSEATSLFVTPKLYDDIAGCDKHLIVIESPRVDEIIAQFRQFAMRSGNSVYHWSEGTGVVSMRESELTVPGSQRFHEALRHIQNSLHVGVYLFTGFSKLLRPPVTGVLRQLARQQGHARKLVFIDVKVRMPEGLDAMVHRIVHDIDSRRPPRLRDGRWVT
ncbi:MAG: hypothetical protein IT478_03825 [Xanthomonadales bacterium]|nr:hypothetical protein [Xanthomonadales bacterium]